SHFRETCFRLARMKRLCARLSAVFLALSMPAVALADWKPVEQDEPYSVTGRTGPELYASIGERGPKIGIGRAIAFTNFKLTWRRDYRPQPDGACTLVSAVPRLIVSYVLPKPSQKLSGHVAENWKTFIEGI